MSEQTDGQQGAAPATRAYRLARSYAGDRAGDASVRVLAAMLDEYAAEQVAEATKQVREALGHYADRRTWQRGYGGLPIVYAPNGTMSDASRVAREALAALPAAADAQEGGR